MSPRFLRFLVAGGSAAAVEFVVFALLQQMLASQLVLGQTLSFCAGLLVSFGLNRIWVFKSDTPMASQAVSYAVIALINLVLGNIAITALAGPAGLPPLIAKFVVMGMVAGWNYIIFSKLVFKSRTGA